MADLVSNYFKYEYVTLSDAVLRSSCNWNGFVTLNISLSHTVFNNFTNGLTKNLTNYFFSEDWCVGNSS
jgi:hypothetical protein